MAMAMANTTRQPTSSTTSSWQQQQQRPSSNDVAVYTIWIEQEHDNLIEMMNVMDEWIRGCWQLWCRLWTVPIFQDENELLRISIALLTMYTFHPSIIVLETHDATTVTATATAPPLPLWPPRSIHDHWTIIPMATTTVLLLLLLLVLFACVVLLWALEQQRRADAFMVMVLLTAMLPIAMLMIISLLVVQHVNVVSGCLALAIYWGSMNGCCGMTHILRWFLYPNAAAGGGHDR